jgi:hypothetical protein
MDAQVAFKFTQRLYDTDSAHETGLFNYRADFSDGRISDQYIRFEALLVKKDGWKMIMEYQKSMASREEWEALD